jgi:hypothetical protein
LSHLLLAWGANAGSSISGAKTAVPSIQRSLCAVRRARLAHSNGAARFIHSGLWSAISTALHHKSLDLLELQLLLARGCPRFLRLAQSLHVWICEVGRPKNETRVGPVRFT